MNGEELEFILRMRDEATAILNKVGGGFDKAGKGSKGFTQENKKASDSLTELSRKAKEATKAVAGMWASMRLGQATIRTFATYEQGMLNVQKTTNLSAQAMDDFSNRFDALARDMDGVSIESLLGIAGAAGQLGVTGVQNIQAFTETMGKLQTASDVVGDEGSKSIARLLTITGDGIGQVKTFASVLVGLGNNTAATESEILRMTATLAQSTAQFKIGSTALAGLGAAAAQLDMRPELFGTAVGRTLNRLTEAAQDGTKGMDMLTQATGLTRQQFQAMIADNPTEAFVTFLGVLQALNADGQSITGFLREFQLQGEESIRVLGTAGINVDLFREKVEQARKEAANPVALDKEYENFAKGLTAQWEGLRNSIKLLAKDLGLALGPALKSMISAAKTAVDGIAAAFNVLPDAVKPWVAAIALGAPAIKGLVIALRLVGPAVATAFGLTRIAAFTKSLSGIGGLVLYLINPFKMLRLAIIAVTAFAQGFIGALVAGFGVVPVLIGAAVAAIAGIGIALYKNWDAVKAFFSQSWSEIGTQLVDMITGAFTNAMAKARGIWEDFWNWATGQSISQRAFEANAAEAGNTFQKMLDGMETTVDVTPKINTDGVAGLRGLSDSNREALAGLDDLRKAKEEIAEIEKALKSLREISDLYPESNDARSEAEIRRLEAQLELRRRQLDPVNERLRLMDIEIADAAAITAEERNRLEVLSEIRALEEEIGRLTEQQKSSIEARVRALQDARKNAALKEMTQDLTEQFREAQAITRAEKNRLAVLHEINAFERENGQLKAGQRQELERLIQATQQADQFSSLRSNLDPQGEAIRAYQDDLATLRAEYESGRLSAEKYKQMVDQLNRSTMTARDPFAGQMKSLQQQMDLLRITGDYKDADRNTQRTINQLTEQGVRLTKDQVSALSAANRELQDMEKAQNSGLQGWMNSVGSLKDNLLDLTQDFASGLSDALVGVFTGQKGAITNFLRSIATSMVRLGVNQLMKNMMQGFQSGASGMGGGGGIGGFFSRLFGRGGQGSAPTKDAASGVQDALQAMNAATMNVTAATVMINGSPVGVPGVGGPTTGSIPFSGSSGGSGSVFDKIIGAGGAGNTNLASIGSQINSAVAQSASSAVDNATKFLGMSEHTNASQLNSFMKSQGVDIDAAKTAWCAAFVNSNLESVGVDGTGSLVANSFLKWGEGVNPKDVLKGDVLVQHRNKGYGNTGGHVGFATGNTKMSEKGLLLEMLSGNEKDRVQKSWKLADQVAVRRATSEMGNKPLDAMSTASVPEVQQLTNQWQQQMATANANIAQQMPQAFQAPMQNVGQQFGQVFTQGGNALQQVAPQFQNIAQQAQSIVPQLGGFGQSLTGLMGPLMQAPAATGQFGSAIMQLLQQMSGGMGGGFGGIFGLLGGLFHKGGDVDGSVPASGLRLMPANTWAGAVKHHKGLKSSEYPAILKRGEKVLTANDNKRNMNLIEGLTARLEAQQRQRSQNDRSRYGNGSNYQQTINVYAEDANSFRRSEGQIMADSSVQLRRLGSRNS